MNEELTKQLVRQLKIINFWITLFGTIIVATLLVLGFLVFKVVTFVRNTEQQVAELRNKTTQTLNVKDDLCKKSPLSSTSYCKN
jgi:heme/copper-type cytochrome/quinol oxidase subunit 2